VDELSLGTDTLRCGRPVAIDILLFYGHGVLTATR
jgi:hypothetical protein